MFASKAVTGGLGDTLLNDIMLDLLTCVPGQPTAEALEADPKLHRFVLVFDREGAHASLFEALWAQRIGAITYRKNVHDRWPEEKFADADVTMPDGIVTRMRLVIRETVLGKLTVNEVRRLTPSGHQTAVISSARHLDNLAVAGRMFSRWCQENFFAYMCNTMILMDLFSMARKRFLAL